jgi:serine/threonine-protein kinase RsbW
MCKPSGFRPEGRDVEDTDDPAPPMAPVAPVADRPIPDPAEVLDQLPAAVAVVGFDGCISWCNATAAALYGWSVDQTVGRSATEFGLFGRDLELVTRIRQRVMEGGTWSGDLVVHTGKGQERLAQMTASPLRGPDGAITGIIAVAVDATVRTLEALDHQRHLLDATAARAKDEAHAAHAELEFLLEASSLLATTLDDDLVVQRLARLAVPTLADLCLIDAIDESGELRRLAAAHADASRRTLVRRLEDRAPHLDSDHPIARTARTGRPDVQGTMSDELLRATTRDEDHYRVARELGYASYMCLPLTAKGRTFGTITLLSAGSGRRFTPANLPICEELARQAALAIDRARLYQREHEAAQTLQRSLLPDRLPELAEASLAVRYLPGGSGLQVGGDWYDAVELPDGDLGLAMGDVMGRGIRAASTMGQMRNALRAYAFQGDSPAVVMSRLDVLVRSLGRDELVTVVHGRLDPTSGRLTFSNAGHLPPLLITDGQATFLEGGRGLPLGVPRGAEAEATTIVPPGATLLLYTDGLVEARGTPIDEGLEQLRALVASHHGADPEALCDAVLEGLRGPDAPHDDDVALLVIRRGQG